MVVLLTISLVMVGIGLTLLALALARPQAGADEAGVPAAGLETPAPRRWRPIPLVLGLLLAGVGGVFAVMISMGDPDHYDRVVLGYWPSDQLIDDLDSDDAKRRSDAYGELNRRYAEGELSKSAHRRLAARRIAWETNDRDHPESPMFGLGLVPQVDLTKAREDDVLDVKQWAGYVARATPLRVEAPRRVAEGEPLQMRLDVSLDNPDAPGWVVVVVEELTLGGKPLLRPEPLVVAPNPDWDRPPQEPAPLDERSLEGMGLGGGQNQPPIRRVVRAPFTVPAESVRELGPGRHSLGGVIHVYAFDSDVIAPPLAIMTGDMTDVPRRQQGSDDLVAAVLASKLTPEKLEELKTQAHATQQWPVRGFVQIGDAPPPQQPPQEQAPAQEKPDEGGEGSSSGAPEDGR